MSEQEQGQITETELLRRLGELPRRVEPQNDPWPEIQQRIQAEAPARVAARTPWLQFAAAVAVAFALGIFSGQAWQSGGTPLDGAAQTAQSAPPPTAPRELAGALAGAELEYQAAFSEFITIGYSASNLKTATLESIEDDWQEMQDAEAALSAALDQYPENPWLNQRMLELRDRQLEMLKKLAGLDRASRRTET